jgi:PAS domain S-box-containing protein
MGFSKITRDLSERKLTGEALRGSEEQFRRLIQNVTDYAIFMLNSEGRVVTWNLGAQRIKGYSPDEIVGQHFSRFYTEEDREKGEPQLGLETAAREGRFEKEGWRVRKDGTRFWANVVIDTIRDEDGALIGYAKVTRDITERMLAQRALEQTRDALSQSQKMEVIGRLTGGIAHDFNNLLMVILSSLEMLRRRLPDDAKIMALLHNATQAAQRGTSLTQRMLAFARRQELHPKIVNLPLLVHSMTDLLKRSLGPSVVIETRFPLTLSKVQVDTNQLELALLNLAVNARDGMPEGGLLIFAAREESVAQGNSGNLRLGRYVCLSVSDTGEGMDEATLERAIEPFFTTKGVGKGTGLGLSMVAGLAQQLGGDLFLKSCKGKGTTAEIWLPSAEASTEAIGYDDRTATKRSHTDMRPLVVLAVDDDSLVLMSTAAMLEDLGHTAVEASSGKQALDILQQGKAIDLVITDHAMPHMTGAQLVDVIRANWPKLPILLATGYGELPLGVDKGLPKLLKPFDQEDLSQAIARASRPPP